MHLHIVLVFDVHFRYLGNNSLNGAVPPVAVLWLVVTLNIICDSEKFVV